METFALVALLIVNGEVESFVLDHGMSRTDCRTVARFATYDSVLAAPGLRIVWETASDGRRLEIRCVAEMSA